MFAFAVKTGIVLVSGIAIVRLCLNRHWRRCRSDRRLDGKTVIISGANSGIGKQTARQLLQKGAKVILACRDQNAAIRTIEEFKRSKRSDHGIAVFKHLDLNSLNSVYSFAKDIIDNEPRLDILINNAGVFKSPFMITEDGFETNFSVNHIAHALLTMLLLQKLSDSGTDSLPSRIVFVSSLLYKRGQIRDIDFEPNKITLQSFDHNRSYANSKLASLLFGRQLAKEIESRKAPVKIFIASPGFVLTNLSRHIKSVWKIIFLPLAYCLLRTPTQGSQTILHCALEATENGAFYRNCQIMQFEEKANDENLAKIVYEKTLSVLKLQY
ncbi:retinol dehydrogenase 12-like protein [Dinothrombium tinctorium]|uniref:Retinol dehydrogenase 12-like protein n=1 Tax=Dinothrombium tinctorium TaxID=1965070 RepID=A0A443QWY3_9ACAR|nr:retinol dehydrogenase 12-like protein [Dinothrombium tinctorium]